jgi:NADPH:quinone reductase
VSPRVLIVGSAAVEGFWLGNWAKMQSIPRMLRLFRQVRTLIREGALQTDVAATYSLERFAEAVAHAAAPGKGGKIVFKIG